MRTCLSFVILLKFNNNMRVPEKNIFCGKEMAQNINDRSETELSSIEDPLNMHKTASSNTTLVSKIQNIINNDIVTMQQGKEKSQFQF